MFTRFRFILLIAVFAVPALLLCSCYPSREIRQAYIDQKTAAFPDEQFSVQRTNGQSFNVNPVQYHVKSSKYYMGFTAYFSKDGTVADSHYCMYLQDDAVKTITELISSSSEYDDLHFDIQLRYFSIPEITYTRLESFEELRQLRPNHPFLYITLKPDGSHKITKELIDTVLTILQENGYYGTFVPYDDIEWYDISADKIYRTVRTGADGGKMVENSEYHPRKDE